MLLCRKCGYVVRVVKGTITRPNEVKCTNPACAQEESFAVEEPDDPQMAEYIFKNCEELDVVNAEDRGAKIKELLWWIDAEKKVRECPVPAAALETVAAAMAEVIAAHAYSIAITLRRKTNA